MSHTHPPRAIHAAAVAMAGGPDAWAATGPQIRDQYIALAEAAAPALVGGGALPWSDVQRSVEFVLGQNRGMQTARKPDDTAIALLAMRVVEHMQRCGFTVYAAAPSEGHKTHGGKP